MTHFIVGAVKNVRRKLFKVIRTPVEGEGYLKGTTYYNTRREPDGEETATLEVYVDVEALVKAIGLKAMANKTGITKLQGGAIMVRAVDQKRV